MRVAHPVTVPRPAVVRIGVAALLLGTLSVLGALPHVAAPVLAEGPSDWQVWLDKPLPKDPAPGSALHLGFIAWDKVGRSTVNIFGFGVRLHPASGKDVVEAQAKEDWSGHSVVDLVVPPAGLGRLEFGMWADAGIAGHTMTVDFRTVPVKGVGPPPDISLRLIGTVRPRPTAPAVAGQPFDVDLTFEPRLDWPAASLPLPDALTLRVRPPGTDTAQDVGATLVDQGRGAISRQRRHRPPGPYVLEAAMEPDAPVADRFDESLVRVVVGDATGPAASAPATPAAPAPSAAPGASSAPAAPAGSAAPTAATAPGAPTVSGSPGPADPGPPAVVLILGAIAAVALAAAVVWFVRFLRAEW